MKYSVQIISAVVFVAVALSCATLSENECLEADWFEVGRRDGSLGKQRSIFRDHYNACLEYQVRADRKAYYEGRAEGLNFFCTKQNGFEQGRRGRSYGHVCPVELESDFLAGYTQGKDLYKYVSKVNALEKRLKNIEDRIREKEKLLSSSELSDDKRAKIRSDLKYLDIEHRNIIRETKELEKLKPRVQVD